MASSMVIRHMGVAKPWKSLSEKRRRIRFLRETRFANVEQGIFVLNGSALHVRPLPLLVAAQ